MSDVLNNFQKGEKAHICENDTVPLAWNNIVG